MATIIVVAAIAAAAYFGAKEMGGKPSAVKAPPIPAPVATPDFDLEREKRKRPKHGTGKTILTGSLEPTDVKRKKLLGAEPR